MRFKIYENGKLINTIVSDEAFCKKYCADNGYVYTIDEIEDEHAPQTSITPTREDEIDAILIDYIKNRLTKLEYTELIEMLNDN